MKARWGLFFLLSTSTAAAQQAGTVAMERYDTPEHGSEWFVGDSLDIRGKIRPTFGVVWDGAYRVVVIEKDGKIDTSLLRDVNILHAGGSLVVWDRVRVGLDVPMVVFQDTGKQPVTLGSTTYLAPSQQALGDLRIGADVRIFGTYASRTPGRIDESFLLAAGMQVHFPTGSQADYASDGTVRFAPRVLAGGDLGPFTWAARLGFMLNRNESWVLGSKWGHEFQFAFSAGARLLDRQLVIGPELWGSAVIASNPSGPRPVPADDGSMHPVEALFGAHYTYKFARFGAGMGTALSHDLGAPQFRWLLSVEWVPPITPDTDGDGITDDVDQCPTIPGIAFAKKNGCPADQDDDGVWDSEDACPTVPGSKDNRGCPADEDGDGVSDDKDRCPTIYGTPANHGCPPDTDKDGVWDSEDVCPAVPGPKTNKGCPLDDDHDGVPNDVDACPDQPGVPSKKKEFNGCPADADGDGIDNDADACPTKAGRRTTDPMTNGCPAATLSFPSLTFRSNSANLADLAPGALDQILELIKTHPEARKLTFEGHADGTEAHATDISANRAATIVKWLTAKGIAADRLTFKGAGSSKPVDRNTDEEGRARNRRVEIHVEW